MFNKKVIKQNNLKTPLTITALPRVDFQDTFSTTNKVDSLEDICQKILNTPPWWVNCLFLIRNTLANSIGLKASKPDDYNENFKVGGYIGIFKIYNITDTEVLFGADDKHLSFRLSILNAQDFEYNIKVTTLVLFHNQLGRYYMKVILPFHKLVIRSMVGNAAIEKI